MRDIIKASIEENHFLKCATYSIARNGEGLTPCLSISIPENLSKYWAYLDFKKPNGEKFKTPRIDVADNKIVYNIPHAVLDEDGKLEVQVVFQNGDGEIWKTYVKEFAVRYSINATDDIPDKQDFIAEAQKVLDEAVETTKSIEERANNGEFNGKDGKDGTGIGGATTEGGEIFNLYEDTETDIEYNGIRIGKQTLPKNKAGQYAHAEGVSTTARGEGSHAEGVGTVAGAGSHVEGRGVNFTVNVTEIIGKDVTVKSNNSNEILKPYELEAIKKNAVIWYETDSTKHNGEFYYVVNAYTNKVLGVATSSELVLNKAPNFSVGTNLTVFLGSALSYISHVEGNYCNAVDIEATNLNGKEESGKQRQHAEGSRTLSLGYASHSEGEYTIALGGMSHAEGNNTKSEGAHSHAEGRDTNAIGLNSHAEGWNTSANGQQSHAEGWGTTANADNSHTEGYCTETHGINSHAEGNGTEAHGTNSHAEGNYTKTWSSNAHAEGHSTSASGTNSHAEGDEAKANGENAHAEGHNTRASGKNSHAEGESTTASGENAHAEGNNTKAWANNSHVSGLGTRSTRENQNVCGSYNKDNDDAIHIVGNGTDENNRSNAFEVYADGHAEVQTMGDTDNSVATKEYVDNKVVNAGGETYELIEDITLTEDISQIERTVEPNGTPYNFRKVMVLYTSNAKVGEGNIQTTAFSNDKGLGLTLSKNTDTTNSDTSRFEFEANGVLKAHLTQWSKYSWVAGAVYGNPYIIELNENDTITKVKCSATTLPAGFNIKIYGVRA